jgi:hypothetical protein
VISIQPAISLLLFIILKLINRRGWVELGNWRRLHAALDRLDSLVMHSNTVTGGTTFVAPASSPSPNGIGMEQARLSDYSEGRLGYSPVGSARIPSSQAPLHPQSRQDRLSQPLSEMSSAGNESTGFSQTYSPVSPDDITAPYQPHPQYFPHYQPNQHQFS